jgi:hydrogenase expression/formation protein HypC
MCLAVPMKVISIDEKFAEVEARGVRVRAGLHLLEDVSVGDFVLIHAGFAIEKVDESAALEVHALLDEVDIALSE